MIQSPEGHQLGRIPRRTLLGVSSISLATLAVSACDPSTDPDTGTGDRSGGGSNEAKPKEAELAELVESGDLPELAGRLPAEPLVVEPTEEIGVYGGARQSAVRGHRERQLAGSHRLL